MVIVLSSLWSRGFGKRIQLLITNEHAIDRALRVALGVGLLAVTALGITALGYLGLIPLATGLLGSCPLYSALGLSTCRVPGK